MPLGGDGSFSSVPALVKSSLWLIDSSHISTQKAWVGLILVMSAARVTFEMGVGGVGGGSA